MVVLARCEEAWACCLTPLADKDYARSQLGPYPLSLMNRCLLAPPPYIPTTSNSIASIALPSTPGSPLTDIEDEDLSDEHIPSFDLGSPMPEDEIIIIETLFDPEDPVNKQLPFQEGDAHFILEWTRKERMKAERAYDVEDVEDLKHRVSF